MWYVSVHGYIYIYIWVPVQGGQWSMVAMTIKLIFVSRWLR